MSKIPEDLQKECPLCSGKGTRQLTNFRGAGEMDSGKPPETHSVSCYLCKGKGKVWALDEQEMAEQIAALREQLARASAPVSEEECHRFRAHYGDSTLSVYWISRALGLFLAARGERKEQQP